MGVLNERDGVRIKVDPPRGVLAPTRVEAGGGHARYWPSPDLAPFVEHHWTVRWDVAEPRAAETVPHPSVHLVLERGRSEVVGVLRSRFTRVLEGRGRVVATKFHPGAFRAFVPFPLSTLADRRVPAADVFGPRVRRLERETLACPDDAGAFTLVEDFLRARRPVADAALDLVRRAAARIVEDRALTRVDDLAREMGLGVRALQRLFADRVGASPKWVIRRYRLLDAVERVAAGRTADWAALAGQLGYADQAHFIRDFKKLVGTTPHDYGRRAAGTLAGASR